MCSIDTIDSDIIQFHILNKLDGASLAAASCASSQLLSLCTHDYLWKQICNSRWPSTSDPSVRAAISAFPSGHRSFYSDSFPASLSTPPKKTGFPNTSELISAVDIFYGGDLIYSKVLNTETISGIFLCSRFRLDLLHQKEMVVVPLKFDGDEDGCMTRAAEHLRVSWILIDPSSGRAVNVASGKAVEARWQYLTEDMDLRYATVVDGGGGEVVQFHVEVNCGGDYGGDLMVREVRLEIEDVDGRVLTGLESLGIIEAAMEGERRRVSGEMEKEIYERFRNMQLSSGIKQTSERGVSVVVFTAAGISIFLVIIWIILSGD
ncbi:hypothetical protein CASFOL_036644 [Castilleja foliolosa]|uniref:F-box protein n=1 Tax=Castilleja foliolosa TaxID=1961234 RepID=A0ABD3BPK6_9LAMI